MSVTWVDIAVVLLEARKEVKDVVIDLSGPVVVKGVERLMLEVLIKGWSSVVGEAAFGRWA